MIVLIYLLGFVLFDNVPVNNFGHIEDNLPGLNQYQAENQVLA